MEKDQALRALMELAINSFGTLEMIAEKGYTLPLVVICARSSAVTRVKVNPE
jgi:hypothetical protein